MKFLFSLLSLFMLFACNSNYLGETKKIISELELLKDEKNIYKHVIKSTHLKIMNGGMPPKFYLEFGKKINSMEEKDIVFIEIGSNDTLVQQYFRNKIDILGSDFYKGDTLLMSYEEGHIQIWKE